MLHFPVTPVAAAEGVGLVQLAQRTDDLVEHGWKEKEIDELGVKLRSASAKNDLGGGARAATTAVSPRVGDRVVRVGDADDARLKRDLRTPQPAWISASVPGLVMRQHTLTEVRIEARQRLEHLGTALRMGRDELPFAFRELAVLVDHVVDGGVDFSDIMEERNALDAAYHRGLKIGGARENQRVRSHSTDVLAGFVVVRVDRVEQGFECRRRESLGGASCIQLTGSEEASDRTGGEPGDRMQQSIGFRHMPAHGQEVGDEAAPRRK